MAFAVYNGVVLQKVGDSVSLVPGAHIEVRAEIAGQPLAALKLNRDGSTGLGNPFDADADGQFELYVVGGFYQIRAYTGSSVAPTYEDILRYVAIGLNAGSDSVTSITTREVIAAGAVTIAVDDADLVIVNKTVSEATVVNLPAAATFTRSLFMIKDGKFDATNYPISVTPNGSETIDGQTGARLIDYPGGGLKLAPVTGGWITLP